MSQDQLYTRISKRLNISLRSTQNTIELLEGGATIPFISRYRKEATGELDEVQIASIQSAWNGLNDLIKRRTFIIETIEEQGKLTPELKKVLELCWNETDLEDLYLPYKKKRKTRATLAKELGLEPLAEMIWEQRSNNISAAAKTYIKEGVENTALALQGARDILSERINEDPEARSTIRNLFERGAYLVSKVITSKKEAAEKYKDYFDYDEAAKKAPAHRVLAVFRGEKEGLLNVKIEIEQEDALMKLERKYIEPDASPESKEQMQIMLKDCYKRLLSTGIETEFRNINKERADTDAISVFYENLRQLLLTAPLGTKATLAIDPGFYSGCKVVCLDKNGNLIHDTVIYPHPPQKKDYEAKSTIEHLVDKHGIQAIAIGNGTAGKETYALVKSMNFKMPVQVFMVNESGASIYSASSIARAEFPDKDVTVRGAVSIGRRLMDPLSELVKIDPKSIGVGQYQHDVNQTKLKADLDRCVESAVNAVGINLNTASEHVLTYISGLGPTTAKNIVEYRSENGSFDKIQQLKKVPRMGEKAFEQCAGFLRIRDGKNPLDNTGVHPERYNLVKAMAGDQGADIPTLLVNGDIRKAINPRSYVSDEVGLPTIKDILSELAKPGLDIRGSAKAFDFSPGINEITDLHEGMMVNGIVNNITKFGAFVDIGIKDSGLIHVSQMANHFVKDPLEVLKLNQEVVARVIEVDVQRKRVSLSLKS